MYACVCCAVPVYIVAYMLVRAYKCELTVTMSLCDQGDGISIWQDERIEFGLSGTFDLAAKTVNFCCLYYNYRSCESLTNEPSTQS